MTSDSDLCRAHRGMSSYAEPEAGSSGLFPPEKGEESASGFGILEEIGAVLGAGHHDKSLGARIRRPVQASGVSSEFLVLAAGQKEHWDLKSPDGGETSRPLNSRDADTATTPATSMLVAATRATVPPIEAPTRMIRFAPRRSSSRAPATMSPSREVLTKLTASARMWR